jgi:O-antigen/teichoic acid export membrane protein
MWRIVAAAGGMAASFLLSVIVVRTLAPRDAATFFAILAALSIGPLIGRLGLGANVIRLMPAEPDTQKRRQIAGTHLLAAVVLSSVSAPVIGVFGCIGLIGHSNFLVVYLLAVLLIATESIRMMVSDIFAAAGRVQASVATMHYVRSVAAVPFVALTVLLLGHETLEAVLGTYLVVAVIQFAVALIHARHEVAIRTLRAGFSTLRTAIGQGARVFSIDFSEFMIMQGTIWLATAMLAPTQATQYAVAVTLGLQVTLFKSLAQLAVAPPAARLWAAGKKVTVVRLLSNAATLSTCVAVILVVLIAVFGPFAVKLAYGPNMGPTAVMLLIIAAGGAVQAFFNVSVTLLIISGHLVTAGRTALIVLAVAAPSAVAAAHFGGPVALAVVTSVSLSVMYTSQYFNARTALASAPRAHRHVVRAAREILSDPVDGIAQPLSAQAGTGPRDTSRAVSDGRP